MMGTTDLALLIDVAPLLWEGSNFPELLTEQKPTCIFIIFSYLITAIELVNDPTQQNKKTIISQYNQL